MPVPYTFASATAAIPLSNLDSNFATAVTIGNTAVQLGNTITTLNNVTINASTLSSCNIAGGGANGVVYINTSNVATANASVFALDGNGNLGLGVTPSAHASSTVALQFPSYGVVAGGAGYNALSTGYNFYYNGGFKYIANGYATMYQSGGSSGIHTWNIAANNSSGAGASLTFTQAMTLDNSGVLAVGTSTTSSATRLVVQGSGTGSSTLASFKNSSASTVFSILENCTTTITGSSVNGRQLTLNSTASGDVGYASFGIIKYDNNTSTSQIFQQFFIGNGGVSSGQINANGANQAAFGAYSDITLKTNIVPLGPQLANINKIEVIEFDYIESEGGGHQIGFSAQNMQTVYPDAVGTREDGKLTLAGWNKTEARLVKAIQELSALVTSQATEIAALKAKVGA